MKKTVILLAMLLCVALVSSAQALYFGSARVVDKPVAEVEAMSVSDSLLAAHADEIANPFDQPLTLPDVFFMPAIYDAYSFDATPAIGDINRSGRPEMRWIEDYRSLVSQMKSIKQNLFFQHPELVKYNVWMLPEAPQPYVAVVNPSDFSINVVPAVSAPSDDALTISAAPIEKRHWIRNFNASLQFSQAYVSPNWYQGGNNNLNALANIYYNVKLNQEYHPNLLFETTAQYKLGLNNAPDDSIHAYNVSEDVFQLNTTFGVKAARRWYYSFTGQFKTQLLKSYTSNTRTLNSAFLSPGELTMGLGMTYDYASKGGSLKLYASIAPLSYHLVTCTNPNIDPGIFGIDAGRRTKSDIGSSAEMKLNWKISYNIFFTSRLFAFTEYESFQADWENTLSFEINRFLTTQIYAHLRYDTRTPRSEDLNWHKLQVKEIFSIGFAYKFSSL